MLVAGDASLFMTREQRRAQARGELHADVDLSLAADLLFGALYQRLLVTGEPVTIRVADKICDLVLKALST